MSALIEVTKDILIAWRVGSVTVRRVIVIAILLVTTAIIISAIGRFFPYFPEIKGITEGVGAILGIFGGILVLSVMAYQKSNEETQKENRIQEVEKRVQDNPKETQAAWELARVKLESYLNRNLNQVRSIFWLTAFVMIVGFSLISFGVYTVFTTPDSLKASIIATSSGLIVNFIGASFLVLYKSTMAQAKDYVTILERINAVGMSVQILETIEDDENGLKQKTTAEISKQLLALYTKNST